MLAYIFNKQDKGSFIRIPFGYRYGILQISKRFHEIIFFYVVKLVLIERDGFQEKDVIRGSCRCVWSAKNVQLLNTLTREEVQELSPFTFNI